eukprot:4466645-Prymnesium_polylepis.1
MFADVRGKHLRPPSRPTDLLSPQASPHRSIATPTRSRVCNRTARSLWPWAPSAPDYFGLCVCHAPNLGAVPSQRQRAMQRASSHPPTSRAGSRDIAHGD